MSLRDFSANERVSSSTISAAQEFHSEGSLDLSLSRKARSASPLSIFEPFNSPISKSRPLSWLCRRLLLNAKSALSRMDLRSRLHSVSGTKSGNFRTPCRVQSQLIRISVIQWDPPALLVASASNMPETQPWSAKSQRPQRSRGPSC